jgi:hypothetical protein
MFFYNFKENCEIKSSLLSLKKESLVEDLVPNAPEELSKSGLRTTSMSFAQITEVQTQAADNFSGFQSVREQLRIELLLIIFSKFIPLGCQRVARVQRPLVLLPR